MTNRREFIVQLSLGTGALAVTQAMAEAVPGDIVLLAPAAASFDQYDNFEKRGDDFTHCVQAGLAVRS